MGKFSKIFHHIESKDLRNKHEQKKAAKIQEEKKKKELKQYLVSTMETKKYDWREGMTTSDAFSTVLPAEGETAITQVNPIDSASFADVNNMFGAGFDNPGLNGAVIRASGSGTGSNNGFDVGGNYLAFQGLPFGDSFSRMALLKPMDATNVDTLTIRAIRGTGSNGGEHPDVVGSEELFVIYKTPEMSRSSYLSQDRNNNNVGAFPADAAIIAINQGDGTLQDYTITIPEYARQKDVVFGLFQLGFSGSEYDHYGVTDIKFQRKTPLTVVVPLDSPDASSFIRSAPPASTPKKRKKLTDAKLEASDEYTGSRFGNDFPGREVRVGGDDPFASAKIGDDVEPSPQSKAEVKKTFGAAQLKGALGKPITSRPTDRVSTFTDVVRSQNTVTNQKISGIQPVQGDFSNIGDGGKGKMPKDFTKLSTSNIEKVFANENSVEAREATVDILSKQLSKPNVKTANALERIGKSGETFARYLTGTLPDVIDNKFLGDKYVNSMISKAKFDYGNQTPGALNFGDNILGTTQAPYRVGNEIIVPFNYDFKTNAEELKGRESELNFLQKTVGKVVQDAFSQYSIDGSPKIFGGVPIIGGGLDMILGGVFGTAIEQAKTAGRLTGSSAGEYRPGELKMDLAKIAKLNPDFLDDLLANKTISEEEYKDLKAGKPLNPASGYEKLRKDNPDLPSFSELTAGIKLPDIPKEGWTYEEYIAMMNAIGDQGAAAEDPIVKEIIAYGPTGTKVLLDKNGKPIVPRGLFDAQQAITIAVSNAQALLAAAWEAYNKNMPLPPGFGGDEKTKGQGGFGGGQGNATNRRGSGFDTQGALDDSGYGYDPDRDTETDARPPEDILSGILGTQKPTPTKDLSGFKKDAANLKINLGVTKEARNSVKNSPEINAAIGGMTFDQQKAAVERMYPEKAQEILDTANNNVIKTALEQGISAIVVDSIADITQPLIGAKTSANAFNEYNTFLGKVAKDPNTPGATYENPIDMSNQIEKGDMNDLTTTINSGNYQSIVNSIRATNDKDAQIRLKGELEGMIKDTIQGNFGLDNFLHNNVRVNLDHLLKTGKTKLTKGYKFTTGGTISDVEDATSWNDGWAYGAKIVSDALGLEYDTLGAPKVPFPQSFNIGGMNVIPGNIINIPVATATTFGPAIAAKLGLTNTKNFGGSTYDSPMMYYEVDVPGKYSVDSKGNTIQTQKPSAVEQIKQTVNNVLDKGKEVVTNIFSFGDDDENAPNREDFPMGRSGAKKFSDATKLYNAAKSFSATSKNINVVSQLDTNASDLPVIPPSEEVAALIAGAKVGGDDSAAMNALAKAHAEMMTKQTEAMAQAEAGGASLESLSALSVRQYLARKPLEDALEIDSPVPPMPSEPIEPQREDYPNTRSGAKQYQDAKKAFDAEQVRKEISELSNQDANDRVFEIFEQDPETSSFLYDPLYENDPVYKEYMGIYDEMEKNATPSGQELLKQQYEALEFTLQGYATEFVDTVLVQPGQLNPFGYENTSNQALTYAGKKDAPKGVYFYDKSEREQFEEAGVDLAKYDEAKTLLDTYADDFDYRITDFVFAQPDYIKAQTEQDRLQGIYTTSNNISKSAWAPYQNFADKYSGREFDLRFEKSEYERVVKRAEELYKAYEDAENKAIDDQGVFLDANTKRGDIFTKYKNQLNEAMDFDRNAKEKRNEYWDNYEQKLKSKMEVIKSKINGDYDYYEDMKALEPQIEELFNRVNREFLNIYSNRDDILAKPEFDPFANELKPDLGAKPGDELASSLSGGSYGSSYDVGGGDFRGIDQIMRMYNDPDKGSKYPDRMLKNIEQILLDLDLVKKPQAPSDPRSAFAGTGDDASTFSFDGGTNVARTTLSPSEESILRNQLNHINRTLGPAAGKREQERLLKMYGIYFPLASGNTSNTQIAHFVPRGKNLSEVMLVKKTKLQRPKQFFKEPNQFFNVNDIKPEFPENPPPKLDPNTGMHPEYGKKAKRYGKLDPISANSMPPTGDPEIDAVVNKQKTIGKIKKMARNK